MPKKQEKRDKNEENVFEEKNKEESENNIKEGEKVSDPKENEKKQNKQLKWIFITSMIIVAITLLSLWVVEESKTFEYKDFKFTKELFGKIQIYTTIINGYSIAGTPINFKQVFRYDPRKIESIPVTGDITFIKNNIAYISLANIGEINRCENSSIAIFSLGYFLGNIGVKAEGTLADKKEAVENNKTFIDCKSNSKNIVMILGPGNETKVTQNPENRNCYFLSFKNCEIMEVIERFEMATLMQSNRE